MRSLIIAILATGAALSIQAQERVVSAAEFNAAEHTADAPFRSKQTPARWTVATESRMDGRPQSDFLSRTVMEFGPNGSRRRSVESSFGGHPLIKTSVMKVDGRTYTRAGDGVWKEEDEATDPAPVKNDTNPPAAGTSYKYLGSGVLNGKKVQLYLRTESRNETSKSTGGVSTSEISARYWFGENADLYMYEYESTTKDGDKVFHTKIMLKKELDPTISIAAPHM